ncbi:crossover junction endonuclease MUS81 isoform X2 [Actinidia eriantha]|uniref:crossover junction endonuclease MUS81 isoform X2 n=1 Tax=Actinidia eriantha TaxID=165200 RepID=UPI002588EF6E|nr:crossover junction endonuclease MUS81 isoform X2 [Actinidia eriantha]
MEEQMRVVCPDNKDLAEFMWKKRQEMAERPKGLSENIETTLHKAYSNVCNSKTPIRTLKEFSQVKGVGKWILRLMQEFFKTDSGASDHEDLTKKGKSKGTRRYVPQKNSVAYALLITLYRGITSGRDFMRRQELIDAAEASGLSRASIAPEKGKGKPGQFGSSPKDWYSGFSSMKTLITKGLVVKSSCPAKYMLSEEGREAARDCLLRSGLVDSTENLVTTERLPNLDASNISDLEFVRADSTKEATIVNSSLQKKTIDVPPESLDRFLRMGYSTEQILCAFTEVSETSQNKEIPSLWPAVLCHLQEEQVYGLRSEPHKTLREDCLASSNASKPRDGQVDPVMIENHQLEHDCSGASHITMTSSLATQSSTLRACSSTVRRLPVGDGIWIARDKQLGNEYVLDFIVERKNVDDLRCSIRDNRYKDQKLRLLRCGVKKLIYVVEGDPNSSEAAESIKTACFTTEILEGFDVQRTSGLGDTLRKYGYLTQAITQYYRSQSFEDIHNNLGVCPPFGDFIRRCQNLDKMTVSDVFAIQLMQVPQVTEEIAIAVLDLYPTLLSLARAYSLLDGDIGAQEEMLKKRSNNVINGAASRNIFQLIWGCGSG